MALALAASFAAGAGVAWAVLRARAPKPFARARVVAPPHPAWLPPQPQPMPVASEASVTATTTRRDGDDSQSSSTTKWIEIDPSATPKAEVYALCISAVVPRPIALVSSIGPGAEGGGAKGDDDDATAATTPTTPTLNVAPYSYFNIVSHDPPTVAIGMCRSSARGGARKDSFANIEATGEFVVNIISEWYVEAANHTCGDFPPGTDEAAAAGLTPIPSVALKAPRLAEAAVQLECVLRTVHPTRDAKSGKETGAIVLAEVVRFHVAEGVAGRSPTGKLVVDAAALAPVSRLGGVTYGRTSELYDLPRPGSDGTYAGGRRGPVASV